MKNRFLVLLIVILMIFTMSSCVMKPNELTFDSITMLLDEETRAVAGELEEQDKAEMLEKYGIEPDTVRNAVFLCSEDENDPREIILIEAAGNSSIDSIKTAFAKIQQEKYLSFEQGDAEMFELVKNYKTAIHDQTMIYAVTENADAVIECFYSIFD